MILTGQEICTQVESGRIRIAPFEVQNVNPNSYDFTLGESLLRYENTVLDAAAENAHQIVPIPDEGVVLHPNRVYLGHSAEYVGSDYYVPILRAKSSIARLGLFIHMTADLIDLGSYGQFTLQFHAVQPVRVYKGMLIGQVTFWSTVGTRELYAGKYQGSSGPVASRSFRDAGIGVAG